ncbi:MAG: AI-2E family transporter, partial [Clostridia bacterium]|nr:AI-2E family transporter [Clostridia bacterium]
MPEKEHSLSKWFGEKKIVRLLLLAALLALGVIHIQWIIEGILFLWGVCRPIVLGAVIAYVLEIIIKRLEKVMFPKTKNKWLIRGRRTLCILIATVLVISILVLLVYTVIPGLTEAFTVLGQEFPNYFAEGKRWVLETFRDVHTVTDYVKDLELDWNSLQTRIINWGINGMSDNGLLSSTVSVIGAVTGEIANILISAIFAIFLLAGKNRLQTQYHHVMEALLPEEKNRKIQYVLDTANRCFSGFIVGQTVNGIILGVLTWLGMRIFKMPYALMVGVL